MFWTAMTILYFAFLNYVLRGPSKDLPDDNEE